MHCGLFLITAWQKYIGVVVAQPQVRNAKLPNGTWERSSPWWANASIEDIGEVYVKGIENICCLGLKGKINFK